MPFKFYPTPSALMHARAAEARPACLSWIVTALSLALLPGGVLAQQDPNNAPPPSEAAPEHKAPEGDGAGQPVVKDDDGTPIISTEQHMTEQEMPTPPGKMDEEELKQDVEQEMPMKVAIGAGVGSELAYASKSVVEVGGSLALTHESETTTLRIAPQLGYFIVDNIELSLFPELSILRVEDESDVSVGGVLEPSYHLPILDRLYGFAGLGLGLSYADDPGVDLFFRPRIGVDALVGRSGIFKPALFMDVGLNDGLVAGGIEAGFTVML